MTRVHLAIVLLLLAAGVFQMLTIRSMQDDIAIHSAVILHLQQRALLETANRKAADALLHETCWMRDP